MPHPAYRAAIDWSDPAARGRYIENLGPIAYASGQESHNAAIVIETANGHAIRPVVSRFGRLFAVGDTGTAFQTLAEARAHAGKGPAAAAIPNDD